MQQDVDHIFIVGLGRTGSTLTRHILNRSPQVGLGGESHYLRDLPRLGIQSRRGFREHLAQVGDLTTDAGARAVVDYLYTIRKRHLNFWNFKARQFDHDVFVQKLLSADRSTRDLAERSLFELAMQEHAGGKPVLGDKTPAHIFMVPKLLEWFPNAKIIHTFRDPRAIYVSRKKMGEAKPLPAYKAALRRLGLGFELLSSLHVMLIWRQVMHCHEAYQAQYPGQYFLLKYEDLVTQPQATLEQLCAYLGIELTADMLQQTVINSSFQPDGAAGFDASSITRWQKHMDPLLKRWFAAWCRPSLAQFGYPVEMDRKPVGND